MKSNEASSRVREEASLSVRAVRQAVGAGASSPMTAERCLDT